VPAAAAQPAGQHPRVTAPSDRAVAGQGRAMWLVFALSGPVLWAVSTHIDKFLVDKYFRDSDTAVLMVFTAFIGVAALPVIWAFDPQVMALPATAIGVMTLSGILYMGAMLFYLRA